MNINDAIEYLKTYKNSVKKDDLGYTITNAQNFTMRVKEQAIINYAMDLKYPKKVTSLIPNWNEI